MSGNRQLPGLAESAERRPPALLQVDTCREEHSGSQRIRPCSPERTELLGVLPAWGILVSRSNKSPPMRADKNRRFTDHPATDFIRGLLQPRLLQTGPPTQQ